MIDADDLLDAELTEPSPEPMSTEQLAAYLAEMEREAETFRSHELAEQQEWAIKFYNADPFGDEEEGRSQVVAPVVQEVVDYMTVSVLRAFVSGERVVEFTPKEPDSEEATDEATEGVNFAFMVEQDGYKVLHDWLKCGLIEKICAVETSCEEDVKRTRRTVTLSDDELSLAMDESGITRVSDNGDGTHSVTFEEVRERKRYIDRPIPNYEFLFSPRTRHEDESEYLAHRTPKSLSDLIEMGFDRDTVEGLSSHDVSSLDSRDAATWGDDGGRDTNERIPGLRKVLLRKEYARIDYDGDGVAELLRVYRVGNTILEAEEVDDQPFVVFTPFPLAHRMVGNSLADKVMDIQRNKSVLMRQTYDGFYLTNQPRMWLPTESMTDDTIDDLLTIGPGVIVRGRGQAPQPLGQNFSPQAGLGMLEFLSGEQESRTGITRLNQGLDADAMNKTATGMALQSSQGQQIEEFVALNFAKAVARLFVKKLRLMIEHGDPIMMRVDGEFKQANPSDWTDDVGVNVRVGLGSGKRDQRVQNRMMLAGVMEKADAVGIVTPKQAYNVVAGLVRDLQLGDPNTFVTDPESEEGQALAAQQGQQSDPEVEKTKIKAQADMAIAREKMQLDAQLQREKMQMETQIAAERASIEAAVAMSGGGNTGDGYRPGGSLAA